MAGQVRACTGRAEPAFSRLFDEACMMDKKHKRWLHYMSGANSSLYDYSLNLFSVRVEIVSNSEMPISLSNLLEVKKFSL